MEISTIIYFVMFVFFIVTNISNGKVISIVVQTGDMMFTLLVLSLLGRKWNSVHNYSLLVAILVRGISVFVQLYMVSNDLLSMRGQIDYTSWQTQLLTRVYIPGCLIAIVEFRMYIFFVLPLSIAIQAGITVMTENVYNAFNCE